MKETILQFGTGNFLRGFADFEEITPIKNMI